ncbi:hypothetical protein FJY68_11730 [candidate division WOR-3 bacterium]|uniref:Uncharacterized protein n=1 Tax=candidate division WOR-3 bacterium TaxID=2052148 RepID=A0A937XG41_UNCW3|nr:hypothetical protein [candidate division WOR-3 bacterium]
MFDPELMAKLVAVAVPFFGIWFATGIAIATLYHLSLFYLDCEYRSAPEFSLDLLVGILRGLAYVFVWPAIFYFDRSALYRIKMLFRYMDPKLRYEDDELAGFIAEGRRRVKLRKDTIAAAAREDRRAHEVLTGEERARFRFTAHDGNPVLENMWLMMAEGMGPGGGRQLVRIWEPKDLPDEVREKAMCEVGTRTQRPCGQCGTVVPYARVDLPELLYLLIQEEKSEKMLLEGWALRGNFAVTFHPCPECDTSRLGVAEDVTAFGRASDVVAAVKAGITIQEDLPG